MVIPWFFIVDSRSGIYDIIITNFYHLEMNTQFRIQFLQH